MSLIIDPNNPNPKPTKAEQLGTMFAFVFGIPKLLEAKRQSVLEQRVVALEEKGTFNGGEVLIRVEFDGREKLDRP